MTHYTRLEPPLKFRDLRPQDAPGIFSACPGCIYWELPEEFKARPPEDEMLRLKRQWLARHADAHVLGVVALDGEAIKAFIQFGPPELYPQRLNYRSGPVSDDTLLITCLYVTPSHRGQGVASQLLSMAERAVVQQYGFTALETFARRGSADNPSGPIELFLECGFQVLRQIDEFPLLRKTLQ